MTEVILVLNDNDRHDNSGDNGDNNADGSIV